ncbi:amidohydrolase, partial [Phocaeicola coprophilus]|nr:amidohydrolase [Phocaeicola coprophilus]
MPKLLLKSGIVVTQDPKLGVLPCGDVLIEDGRVAAVAPSLAAGNAEIVDCAGHFVLPGLINAHM